MISFSRVRNKVNLRHSVIMLYEFFLMKCVEVHWERLSSDSFSLWLASLRSLSDFEWLEHLLVGCLIVQWLRLIVRYSKVRMKRPSPYLKVELVLLPI